MSLTLYIPVSWVFRPMVRLWLIQQCSRSWNLVFLTEKLSQIIGNVCCTYGDSGSLPALFKCCRGSWLEGSQHSQVGCERWACYQPGQKGVCPLEITQWYQNQLVDKVSVRFWKGVWVRNVTGLTVVINTNRIEYYNTHKKKALAWIMWPWIFVRKPV